MFMVSQLGHIIAGGILHTGKMANCGVSKETFKVWIREAVRRTVDLSIRAIFEEVGRSKQEHYGNGPSASSQSFSLILRPQLQRDAHRLTEGALTAILQARSREETQEGQSRGDNSGQTIPHRGTALSLSRYRYRPWH